MIVLLVEMGIDDYDLNTNFYKKAEETFGTHLTDIFYELSATSILGSFSDILFRHRYDWGRKEEIQIKYLANEIINLLKEHDPSKAEIFNNVVTDYTGEDLINKNWFTEYYGFDRFDYIILVARKGYSIYRALLRAVKAEIKNDEKMLFLFNKLSAKVIIINTRTTAFYSFNQLNNNESRKQKSTGKLKCLLFDDLLGKGRNVTRITISLIIRGILPENIYYAALGFHQMQRNKPKEGTVQKTWISQDETDKCKYYVNFEDEYFDSLINSGKTKQYIDALKRINLFLPYSVANENFLSSKLFLERSKANTLSRDFNRYLHYCTVPYTGYMSYTYFNNRDDNYKLFSFDKLKVDYKKITNILAIDSIKGACEGLILDYDSNISNGYYTSVRFYKNIETHEVIIHPYVSFPALSGDIVKKLYRTLFAGIILSEYNEVMAQVYNYASDNNVMGETYRAIAINFDNFGEEGGIDEKNKNIFEHMSRAVLSVLSAIIGIRIFEQYRLFSDDYAQNHNKGKEMFARNVCRYLCAHKRGDDEGSKEEIKSKCIDFLERCYNNVYEISGDDVLVRPTFNFKDDNYNDECPTLVEWKDYCPDRNKENKINDWENLIRRLDEYPEKSDVKYLNRKQKREPIFYILDIVNYISIIDEHRKYKIPPIPVKWIIEKSILMMSKYRDSGYQNLLMKYGENKAQIKMFEKYMVALQSLIESGIINATVYSEHKPGERFNYVNVNALQCGEMTMLGAYMLVEEYGGWSLLNPLRDIYLEMRIRKAKNKPTDKFIRDLKKVFIVGLSKSARFSKKSEKSIRDEANSLMRKVKYLFANDLLFLWEIKDYSKHNPDIKELIKVIQEFSWFCKNSRY